MSLRRLVRFVAEDLRDLYRVEVPRLLRRFLVPPAPEDWPPSASGATAGRFATPLLVATAPPGITGDRRSCVAVGIRRLPATIGRMDVDFARSVGTGMRSFKVVCPPGAFACSRPLTRRPAVPPKGSGTRPDLSANVPTFATPLTTPPIARPILPNRPTLVPFQIALGFECGAELFARLATVDRLLAGGELARLERRGAA